MSTLVAIQRGTAVKKLSTGLEQVSHSLLEVSKEAGFKVS